MGKIKAKHEIEGVRFHDLRHEAISPMFDEGMTVPEVATISYHRTVSMLFRYASRELYEFFERSAASRKSRIGTH